MEQTKRKTGDFGTVFAIAVCAAIAIGLFFDSGNPSAPKSPDQKMRDRLVAGMTDCIGAVRSRTKFPSKAQFAPDADFLNRLEAVTRDTKAFTYRGRVDLMNGFGAMVPHHYFCVIDIPKWSFVQMDVTPG